MKYAENFLKFELQLSTFKLLDVLWIIDRVECISMEKIDSKTLIIEFTKKKLSDSNGKIEEEKHKIGTSKHAICLSSLSN